MDFSFAYDPAASTLHDETSVARILGSFSELLARAGGERVESAQAPRERPLFHVVLTGGTERIVLDRVAARAQSAGREPVVLVAHPQHNSLPASLEILARVRRDGGVGRIVYVAGPDDAEGGGRLADVARLAGVSLSLRSCRIGAIGEPSDWLVASAQSPEAVRGSWGPELVSIPLAQLTERLARAAPDAELAADFTGHAACCREPGEEEISLATAVYQSLRAMVEEQRLDAVTLRCFDLVTGPRTTGCLALSKLADDGVPAGCEGDVPSALALLWLQRLTGQAGWMANPSRIELGRGELLVAHCTIPRSAVQGYDLRSHFESGLGAAIHGELAEGPVTLFRLGGEKLEELWTCEGQLVASGCEEGLCRTQATIRVSPAELAQLLERPLGNHVIVARGHLAALLRDSRRFVLGVD